jgi:HD-GYP domain-containing protein (c-di-GMP phosphodiesterase class II)
VRESLRNAWTAFAGPRGWRSVTGPASFALLALVLLVFDHLQRQIDEFVFWLTVTLIACVFVWLVETARKKGRALEREHRKAMSDQTTGLRNRTTLQGDIAAELMAGKRPVLVLLELEGLQSYYDRFGYVAGDELVRGIAHRLMGAVDPLGGTAYRIDASRFAVLAPADGGQLGEVFLAATASLHEGEQELLIGRSYGEVALPDDADSADLALQIAGRRLAAHKQHQHRSARRQAHAVLMAALSARRPELRDHLRAVAYRTISLARRLGASREEIDDIALAAELQDIGLLAVPEAVLETDRPLSDVERALLHSHPVAGERIIGAAPGLTSVASLVRAVSERFDGSGYPDGLVGEAIPLGSRIIAVAVAFAAMTATRPHRQAVTVEEALGELRRCGGTQFDPQVVEAMAADLAEEADAPTFSPAGISAIRA